MIRHRRPPAPCHTRQIDINVIISGGRAGLAVQLARPLDRRPEPGCMWAGEVRYDVAPTCCTRQPSFEAAAAAAAAAASELRHRHGCMNHT